MLSIVLYGRNDNYGYNLHKRAALSLNCMAEVLTNPEDEILFVDYNTPDDFPTFPEAIQDTLTDKAKSHLRVLRVRPAVHARFASRTHLVALEPVARNVAVRRSNPANRWILSTNTDMIFVPRGEQSLTDVVRDLPTGHYGIPRFEIPETLWESLDRRDARSVIDTVGRWGWDLHLNEVVAGYSQFLFDAPGDFQLIERKDLFTLHGFHEGMLLGWHVDSNIAKRLSLVHGSAKDLSGAIFGYHCDHTRQVTPMHRRDAVENSLDDFYHRVERPDVIEQADNWGCADAEIEEIRLQQGVGGMYLGALKRAIIAPLKEPLYSSYLPETFDKSRYFPDHLLPFLLDLLASVPRQWSVGWVGGESQTFTKFRETWSHLGFTGSILIPSDFPSKPSEGGPVRHATLAEFETADAYLFHFARGDGAPLEPETEQSDLQEARSLIMWFFDLLAAEEVRLEQGIAPRRFIGINAIHNRFERLFRSHVNVARTPFSVRIRHGFVFPPKKEGNDWLPQMLPGAAGIKEGSLICGLPGKEGHIAYGPYILPPPGKYSVSVNLECEAADVGRAFDRAAAYQEANINLEVAIGSRILSERRLTGAAVLSSTQILQFEVTSATLEQNLDSGLEIRIYSNGSKAVQLKRVLVRRTAA